MTRHGIDIRLYPLKSGVEAGINHSMTFLEWEAATAAGLDMYKWETFQYPQSFKARVVAWYRLHGLVESHQQEAAMSNVGKKTWH